MFPNLKNNNSGLLKKYRDLFYALKAGLVLTLNPGTVLPHVYTQRVQNPADTGFCFQSLNLLSARPLKVHFGRPQTDIQIFGYYYRYCDH